MNWIYILVLCLATYYIAARYLEKHIDNFDPSLVPVSSIVTLAKVAQKLVDGNGTLTNPGNLTLGTAAAPGNLVVTGTTNLVGDTKVDGSLTVNGNKGIAINGTDGGTTKTPFKIFNNNNTWLSVTQDSNEYLLFRDTKIAEIDCDTTVKRGLQVNNNLTVINGVLRGNDGNRVTWMDTGWTKIDTRSYIDFVITPPYFLPDTAPASKTIASIDNNGLAVNGNLIVRNVNPDPKNQYAQISLTTPTTNYTFTATDSKTPDGGGHASNGLNLYSYTAPTNYAAQPILQIVPSTGAGIQNNISIYGNLNVFANLTVTGNILNKAAAFRIKFYAWPTLYMTVVNGAPVVSPTINTTNNSDYWIEYGSKLLSLETNKFLTHDGTNFTLEELTGTKRQIVMLLADVGSGSPVPGNRYVFRQLDSDGFGGSSGGIKYAGGSDGSYLGHNWGTKLLMVAGGDGTSHFIKVA